jgi:serine/threonine protein kinase
MLTDFGLSSIFEDLVGSSSLTGSNSLGFSVRWLAVELVRSLESDSSFLRFTPSTDVYSFGSTMLEVLTGRVPYHNRQRDVQVIMDIYQGARHQREDTKISIPLWDFMEHCWSETPDDRPYSNQLVRQLEQHYKMAQL